MTTASSASSRSAAASSPSWTSTSLLDRVLETARELTGARYAALGILDERRRELAQLPHARRSTRETHRAIGDLPRGRGILGVLIDDPRPLRLADVGDAPALVRLPARPPADARRSSACRS